MYKILILHLITKLAAVQLNAYNDTEIIKWYNAEN